MQRQTMGMSAVAVLQTLRPRPSRHKHQLPKHQLPKHQLPKHQLPKPNLLKLNLLKLNLPKLPPETDKKATGQGSSLDGSETFDLAFD